MHAERVATDAPRRLVGHRRFRDQAAASRVPSGKPDAGGLADEAAAAVAADEVARAQRAAVREVDVDAVVVLRESRDLAAAQDGDAQPGDPVGEEALDVLLLQREDDAVAGGQVADVQQHAAELGARRRAALRDEAVGEPALVQHLEAARMQAAGARADHLLVDAPFDDRDVDSRQRQLAGQHQSRRAGAADHHRVFHPVFLPGSPSTSTAAAMLRPAAGLAASPGGRDTLEVRQAGRLRSPGIG